MTREEAVGFLQESGWLQDHDRQIYEQGKRDGIKWHPYPQEKPTEEKVYLVTFEGVVTNKLRVMASLYWDGDFSITDTLAWAELPKPYEEGAEE